MTLRAKSSCSLSLLCLVLACSGESSRAGSGSGGSGGTSSNAGQGGSAPGSSGGAGADGAGDAGEAGSGAQAGLSGAGGLGAGDAGEGGSSGASAGSGAASGTSGSRGDGGSGGAPTSCEGGKVVHFVYFVEKDATFSEEQRADVEQQAHAFQEYWFEQLGVTFYLNDPIVDVIMADNDADHYITTPDGIHSDARWYRLGNIKNEVYDKLGIDDFDSNHRVVNYPTSRHDGRVGANFGGAWMDGDDLTCIATGGFNYPYDDQNSAHCTGHVAHEFGHVLGLDHEGPDEDCMQFGFYTNDPEDLCSFSADNVAKILADPDNEGWFEATPGELCTGG